MADGVKIPYLEEPMKGLVDDYSDDSAWDYYNTPGYADQTRQVPQLVTGGIYDNKGTASSGSFDWLNKLGSGLGSVVGLFGGDSKSGSLGGNPYVNLAQMGLGYLGYQDQKKTNEMNRALGQQKLAQNTTLAKNMEADRKNLLSAFA